MTATWCIAEGIAWTVGPDRVSLVDLRDPASAGPQICPEPAATLWRALAERPRTERELVTIAGADASAAALLDAFLSTFAAEGLIEEILGG